MRTKTGITFTAVFLAMTVAVLVARGAETATETKPNGGDLTKDAQIHSNPPSHTNRLIHSKSPYLIQHAHNPVDWYPWGDEAFAKARKENKPIFLSVGYSTCHWCHVMAHESFENPEVSAALNEHFICIKVDREERPDVDAVYMSFVQATTGGGGWPMSVWLTPDLKPFFGGTYFPPERFTKMLESIASSWKADGENIRKSSEDVVRRLKALSEPEDLPGAAAGQALLEKTYAQLKSNYEPHYGGFGSAPKFPRPVSLNFMLRHYAGTGTKEALDMALFTLRKMAEGGMHDHLGGGFHRYSTDNRWHVPHFEKMLYDQAQLVCSYLEAYQLTHEAFYAVVARDILAYVQRDMTGEDGQFYSAEDADSAVPGKPSVHAEGAFYVWEDTEITEVLGKESAALFNHYYNINKGGNVESDPRGEFPKKNVLIVSHSIDETAKKFGKTRAETEKDMAEARHMLFVKRGNRPRPHLDDKTLTAWNGLMISAFARAYQILEDPAYLEAATKSAQFIKSKLYNAKTGILLRRYRGGDAAIEGFADDYAFLIQGLLDLYEASFDITNLTLAVDLQKKQNELFWDTDHGGGFFSTAGQDANILLRMKEDYDGAEPSPNSVAAMNLLRLSQILNDKAFQSLGEKTLNVFGSRLRKSPSSTPQMMVALQFSLRKPKQIVIAGKQVDADTQAMLRAVRGPFEPNKIVLLADGGEGQAFLGRHLEFIQTVLPTGGKATAYVCENYVCKLPTTDLETVVKLLTAKSILK